MTDCSLAGRVAVVTGTSRGIGRAVALSLSKEGAIVAGIARSRDELAELGKKAEGQFLAVPADVSVSEQVQMAFDRVKSDLGPVTILVAAAGCAWFGDTLGANPSVWERHVATNLTGLYQADIAAIQQMLSAGNGDIINVLSIAADMAVAGSAAYTATKAGGLGLTRALQAEFRKRNIRISALLPGATDTPLWDDLSSGLDRTKMLRAEDVAEAIMWMLKRPPGASADELRLMPREGFL